MRDPEVKPDFLHFLLFTENLAHTFLSWPNPPDMEAKGLHTTGQMHFGEDRPQRGSARDIAGLRSSEDRGRDGLNQPKHG